jgi:hypothetical protein
MFYPYVLFEIFANKAKKQQQIRDNNSNKRLSDNFSQKITNVALVIADPLSNKFGQGFPL